ncbi:helix-turn-helix domain-containing protein [Pseudaminobacter sp. NGMCC 1.201702]|uniref:helix-turn-helix domain-containing protein n=1 Tax=Pseudaminobacter sp. NGMCC 1.201702 TaxID=3391825 RepID=UPI0039EFA903
MGIRAIVGFNVPRLRRERGLSQEELSFRSGFTRAYLSGLEAGRRNPTIDSLSKLAQALDTEIEELIRPPFAEANQKTRNGNGG